MSKRFTSTDKWDKHWIHVLKPRHKLFWVYLLDKCDHAGIWEVNIELAEFQLGIKLDVPTLLSVFKDQIVVINNKSKWFIPGFIDFQYGVLKPDNRVHESVLSILSRYKIPKVQGPCKGLNRSLKGPMDKDKDKDIDKASEELFEELWKQYPRKNGKERARVLFHAQTRTAQDRKDITTALGNKLAEIKRLGTEEKYIQHGSTWFNHHWKDYVNCTLPEPPKTRIIGGVK